LMVQLSELEVLKFGRPWGGVGPGPFQLLCF
jgi:hypothetical protein